MLQIKGAKQISGITGILFYDNPNKPLFAAAWQGDQADVFDDWRLNKLYPGGITGSTGFSLNDIRGCTYIVPLISINRGRNAKPHVINRGYQKISTTCSSNSCDVLNCFDLSELVDGVGKYREEQINVWDGTRGATSYYENYIVDYDIEPGFTGSIYVKRNSKNLLGGSNKFITGINNSSRPWNNNASRYTVTPGHTAPDGSMTASLLEFNTKGYGALRQKVPIIPGLTYTFSFWIKSGGSSGNPGDTLSFNHRFFNNTDPGVNIDINLPSTNVSANSWTRTSAQFYTGTAGVFHIFPYIAGRNGNTGDKFYVWRSQFEPGTTFTDYEENSALYPAEYYPSTTERIQTIEKILGITLDGRIVVCPFLYHYKDSVFGASGDSILSNGQPANKGTLETALRGCCANISGITAWYSLWPDVGIEIIKNEWSTWLDEFSLSGKPINYIGFDNEAENPLDSYTIKNLQINYGIGSEYLKGLTSSPKWYSQWRGMPSIESLVSGFTFTNILNQERCSSCDFEYVKWNNITNAYGTHALNEAVWTPLKQKYPETRGSNYDNLVNDQISPGPNTNGHPQALSKYFGTSSSPVIYGTLFQATTSWFVDRDDNSRLIYKNTGYADPGERLVRNPWGAFQRDQQELRSCVRAFRNGLLQPWIAGISFGSPDSISSTYQAYESQYPLDPRYYYEIIRHAALMRTEMFLYWNASQGPDGNGIIYDEVRKPFTKKIDELLHEINIQIGNRPVTQTITREPILFTNNNAWSTPNHPSKILISGAKLYDGSYLWRATTGEELATSFIDNNTGNIYDLNGDVGVWIKTNSSIKPDLSLFSVPTPLIFYDGSTGEYTDYGSATGKYADTGLELAGGKYMFSVGMATAGWELGFDIAGWTAGTPFYWVKTDEVRGMAQNFTKQGATASTKGYAYINWSEDSREFILFDGHTGPPGIQGGVSRTVEDHDLLQKTMAKYLVGGTGVDGIEFQGLKKIFPGISFGFYNIPPWWRGDRVWDGTTTDIENSLELAANVVVGCTELMDAIDLLMPSCYSVVTKRDHMMIVNEQKTKLCQKINEKLIAGGKTPKQIVPFVEPFYETVASGDPYRHGLQGFFYNTPSQSYARVIHGITKMNFQYTPPYTRMLEQDLVYEAYYPLISNGADGAIIWMGPSYRMKQIAGRTLNPLCCEDIVVSDPYIDGSGNLQWRSGWRKGVTGATAIWSQKDMWRQSLATDWAYRAGICLGITGNRWWFENDQSSSGIYGTCGPAEWFPLSGREGITLGNQPVSGAGMSTPSTRGNIDKYLMDVIKENIEVWKKTWINYKKSN